MYEHGEISTIIKDHIGAFFAEHERLLNAPIVFLKSFTLPSENRYACCSDSGGGMILSRENIA